VSRHHAELRRLDSGQFQIVDLSSHNGTFVNGRRVPAAPVTGADVIGIGPATFRLTGEELREFIDEGDVSLLAQNLTVRLRDGKVLLDHVSFPVGERRLVAIIGPSGAGKSTLLGALTGISPGARCPPTAPSWSTMPLLVLVSMVQIILSGGVIALSGKAGLEQLAWLTPSRWGFGATASTVNLTQISPPTGTRPDPLWAHRPVTWLTDMALQLLLAAVFSALAWRRLVRRSDRS
jgi:hypothetical protein